jgi:hypothetical protein
MLRLVKNAVIFAMLCILPQPVWANCQPQQPAQQDSTPTASASSNPGVLVAQSNPTPDTTKHSCKGKNDCKGQGGGPDPGKNSCKGKGGCATDGSTPPKAS